MTYRRLIPRAIRAGLAVAAVASIGIGTWTAADGLCIRTPPSPSAVDALAAHPAPTHTSVSAATAMGFSPPVRIRIPGIGVDAPVTGLDADTTGHLEVPTEGDRNLAGWYREGPSPGSAGNAIIDGHVDTPRGRAVFYELGAVHKDATVLVTRADHTVAQFSVYAIEVYAKNDFPDQRVYGPTRDPELRLITCGGGYTKTTGYLGNVVVYARLTKGLRPASPRSPNSRGT